MFRKLISNLPFHPTLLPQVAFYMRRLKQEQALRRLGFIFTALALAVQMFAFISPSRASLATSASDIVYGASKKSDVLSAYSKNRDQLGRTDIKAIFNYYGIGQSQIENSKLTTISDGNTNYINTSRSTTRFPDTFVSIPGAIDGGIYEFPLEYWRKGQYPNGYPALTGISTYGFRFWILLKGCGNIVYEKGAKKPALEINKKLSSPANIAPGELASYDINFRNKGLSAAENVVIADKLPDNLAYQSYTSNVDLSFSQNGQTISWKIKNKNSSLAPSTKWYYIKIKTKAKDISQNTLKACNIASIDSSNSPKVITSANNPDGCVNITKKTCPGTGLPIPPGGVSQCVITCPDGSTKPYNQACAVPQLSCESLKSISAPAWNIRKLETTITMQPGAVAKQINYFVDGTLVASKPVVSGSLTQYYEHTFKEPKDYKLKSEIVASNGTVQQSQNCEILVTIVKPTNPEARITTDKKASNITQNISDANNTTAKAGDVIKYTLLISNVGDAPATDFALSGEYSESIADVLEYSNLTEKNDAIYNQNTQSLSWPSVTIGSGKTIEKTFTVTIKNPLPITPTSTSNPMSYDFAMQNKYGREIVIKLDKPATKIVEQTTTTLPNTGPGETLFASVLVTTIVGYFFFRSRLLSKELNVIYKEYSSGSY